MDSQRPRVSVVIPAFDRPHFLVEALRSALVQSVTDLEVVVADNGPLSLAADVVGKCGDDRVRYLPTAARDGFENVAAGIAAARGEFLAILHDDDVLDPRFLAMLLPPLEERAQVVVSFCDQDVVDERGAQVPGAGHRWSVRTGRASLAPGPHQPFVHLALTGALWTSGAAVYRAGSIEWPAAPIVATFTYDRVHAIELARTGSVAWYVPQRLSASREHSSSSGAMHKGAVFDSLAECSAYYASQPDMRPWRAHLRRDEARCLALSAGVLLRRGDTRPARRRAIRSLRRRPNGRAIAALGLSALPSPARSQLFRLRRRRQSTVP